MQGKYVVTREGYLLLEGEDYVLNFKGKTCVRGSKGWKRKVMSGGKVGYDIP